jgi:fluoroacetyl-CoA thioesterase
MNRLMEIPIGTKLEQSVLIDDAVAINFLGVSGARVMATPYMIGFMERTCRDAVLPLLEAGYDTVGTHVDVYHLTATPMGMTVKFTAEVIGVENRRVTFRVEAWDSRGKAGEGTHERAIINVARFTEKMRDKSGGKEAG